MTFTVPEVEVSQQMTLITGLTVIKNGRFRGLGNSRIMHVAGAATVVMERMMILGGRTDGSGAGMLVEDEANLSLRSVTFRDNRAGTDGGGLAFYSNGELGTFKVLFDKNTANGRGGAVSLGGSSPVGEVSASLWASKFIRNEAVQSGGAVDCRSPQLRAMLLASNLMQNRVTGPDGYGGGLASFCEMEVLVSRFFENEVASGFGGGAYLSSPALTLVDESYFQANKAGTSAGAQGEGGGLFLDGPVSLTGSAFYKNEASEEAGALRVGDGAANEEVNIANVTFDSNQAVSAGLPRHGAAVSFTGMSFPLEPDVDPDLGYQPNTAQFVNNTVTDNTGLEQIYFHDGSASDVGQIFFVNNIVRNIGLRGCGGMVDRMRVKRPGAPDLYNLQYPGTSCDTIADPVPTYFQQLLFPAFGGPLGQVYRLPVVGKYTLGDQVVCKANPVLGEDQFGSERMCLMGAIEVPMLPDYPLEFYQ
jgi:predicted outer membrane repeat protein